MKESKKEQFSQCPQQAKGDGRIKKNDKENPDNRTREESKK